MVIQVVMVEMEQLETKEIQASKVLKANPGHLLICLL